MLEAQRAANLDLKGAQRDRIERLIQGSRHDRRGEANIVMKPANTMWLCIDSI